jgi:prophage regulatory protein
MSQLMLKISDVEKICSISRSTIYRMVAKGTFPKPITVSSKTSRWRSCDLEQWAANPDDWKQSA